MTAQPHPATPRSGVLLPVAVIGGGPVGLAAAAHLLARGLPVKVYEAAESVAGHVRDWGHVRLFSPWGWNIDREARALLERTGWTAPPAGAHPTGAELYEQYLRPLAALPAMARVIETGARVTAVSRLGLDKMKTAGREAAPFLLAIQTAAGAREDLASAVIDCTGTWSRPNPIGSTGLPVPGETALAGRIAYGVPDVLGRDIDAYANRRVLVVGAGHSAANVLLDLARLQGRATDTVIHWAVRGTSLARLFGGGKNDGLAARGALGRELELLVQSGRLVLHLGHRVAALAEGADGIVATLDAADGAQSRLTIDRIIAATGQRPDLDMLREVRLDLDSATESPRVLAPLIDPNVHSCGTVRPHGHRELAMPDPGFYLAGIKSYGRAPTFLLATGYEQVRSIAAALAGDLAAADDVQLDLPQTGVCSIAPAAGADAAESCCAPACCDGNDGPERTEAPAVATPAAAPAQAACCGASARARTKEKARPAAACC